jgi:serine/threonine protein kinase
MERRWIVEEQIGRGGMGIVFRARDPATGERAALKRLALFNGYDPDVLARFAREARAAQAIQHRNVVRLLDWGDDHGLPCIVFELVEGGSLADRVRREGPLPWREAAAIAAGVARGLEAVHAAGLVHRDVKPANVLLGRDGAKLSDLGLVKRQTSLDESRALTSTGEVVGTPSYVSPEQIHGEPVTPLTDLYALGGTLYFALTGTPPFEGSPLSVMTKHIEERPLPPSRLRSGVPRDLEQLVLTLLEKDPSARGANAGSVARALDALAVERSRAHRLLLAAAGIFLAGGAVAGALSLAHEHAPPPLPPPPPRPSPPAPVAARSELANKLHALEELPEGVERIREARTLAPEVIAGLEAQSLDGKDRKVAIDWLFACTHWLLRPGGTPEELDEADRLSVALRRFDQETPADALQVRLKVLCGRQRWSDALELLEELERTGPFDPRSNQNTALALAGLGRRDEALARLARVPVDLIASADRERYEDLLVHLANCVLLREQARQLGMAGQEAAALATIEQAIGQWEGDGDCYYVRGTAHQGLGDTTDAIADFTRCYELRSADAPAALAERGSLRDDAPAALDDYARALELDPGSDRTYYYRANTRMRFGIDLEATRDDLSKAESLALEKNRPPALLVKIRGARERLEQLLADQKRVTEPPKK